MSRSGRRPSQESSAATTSPDDSSFHEVWKVACKPSVEFGEEASLLLTFWRALGGSITLVTITSACFVEASMIWPFTV